MADSGREEKLAAARKKVQHYRNCFLSGKNYILIHGREVWFLSYAL